jgi:FAD:protein FMN transferase
MEDTPIIHNFSHEAFGSRFWVRIAAEDGVYARNAAEGLFQLLDDLDFQTDLRHDSGPVASINLMPEGAMIAASEHVQALWNFAKDVSADSGKAFDATAGALFGYWQKRGDLGFNPDDDAWTQVMNAYREGAFRLEGCELHCDKFGCAVDFGAIVRGYALDRMADMLESSWGIADGFRQRHPRPRSARRIRRLAHRRRPPFRTQALPFRDGQQDRGP